MRDQDRRLWPFRSSSAFVATILLLVGLLFTLVVVRENYSWPGKDSEGTVLLGIFIISLLPIILQLVDVVAERGAVVQYKDLKIDFSQVQKVAVSGITIPANIGIPGQAVADSGTTQILDALKQSTSSDIVIVDLEEGQAWWETRLLVLLSGAIRHNKPRIIIFVGKDGGVEKQYQGWAYASELHPMLLKSLPKYQKIYHATLAIARQWELVQPRDLNHPLIEPAWMGTPPGQIPPVINSHSWMAFDDKTGLPNPLFVEQLLASELGSQIEFGEGPKAISLVRLEELFRPVLHKNSIDETWSSEKQLGDFFNNALEYVTITRNGQFKSLVARVDVLNTMVSTLVQNK